MPTGVIPLAAVEVAVGLAREPCLVLVGAPADEQQVHVAVDEAGTIVPSSMRPSVTGSSGRSSAGPTNTIVPSSSQATPLGEYTPAAVAATLRAGSDPVAVASVAATAGPRPIAPAYPR